MMPTLEKPMQIDLSSILVLKLFQGKNCIDPHVTAMLVHRKTGVMYAYADAQLKSCRIHYPENNHSGSVWIGSASFDVEERAIETIRAAFPSMRVHDEPSNASKQVTA